MQHPSHESLKLCQRCLEVNTVNVTCFTFDYVGLGTPLGHPDSHRKLVLVVTIAAALCKQVLSSTGSQAGATRLTMQPAPRMAACLMVPRALPTSETSSTEWASTTRRSLPCQVCTSSSYYDLCGLCSEGSQGWRELTF